MQQFIRYSPTQIYNINNLQSIKYSAGNTVLVFTNPADNVSVPDASKTLWDFIVSIIGPNLLTPS